MFYEIVPNEWASQYVEAYWVEVNNLTAKKELLILPDGCSDIILSYLNSNLQSIITGCMTQPVRVYIEPGELMCGIRFNAGCSSAFLKTSMKEFTDKKHSLTDIIDFDSNIITPDIILSQKERIPAIFEIYLKKLFSEKHFDRIASLGADLIKQYKGLKSIEDIAYQMNISKRQLERKFTDSVGITPKLFSRIIRFKNVIKIIENQNNYSLLTSALDAGYYDQAHFCKDFKEFTGMTPLFNKNMSHFYNTPVEQ